MGPSEGTRSETVFDFGRGLIYRSMPAPAEPRCLSVQRGAAERDTSTPHRHPASWERGAGGGWTPEARPGIPAGARGLGALRLGAHPANVMAASGTGPGTPADIGRRIAGVAASGGALRRARRLDESAHWSFVLGGRLAACPAGRRRSKTAPPLVARGPGLKLVETLVWTLPSWAPAQSTQVSVAPCAAASEQRTPSPPLSRLSAGGPAVLSQATGPYRTKSFLCFRPNPARRPRHPIWLPKTRVRGQGGANHVARMQPSGDLSAPPPARRRGTTSLLSHSQPPQLQGERRRPTDVPWLCFKWCSFHPKSFAKHRCYDPPASFDLVVLAGCRDLGRKRNIKIGASQATG